MLTPQQAEKAYRLGRVAVLGAVLTVWVLLAIAALTSHFGVPRPVLMAAAVYTILSWGLLFLLRRSIQRRADQPELHRVH